MSSNEKSSNINLSTNSGNTQTIYGFTHSLGFLVYFLGISLVVTTDCLD